MEMINEVTGEIKKLKLPEGFHFPNQKDRIERGWQKMYLKNLRLIHDGLTGAELKISYLILGKLTKESNTMHGTITALSKEFGIDRTKMSRHIKKMKDKGLVRGDSPFFIINPFVEVPFGAKNAVWIKLQKAWKNTN